MSKPGPCTSLRVQCPCCLAYQRDTHDKISEEAEELGNIHAVVPGPGTRTPPSYFCWACGQRYHITVETDVPVFTTHAIDD